MQQHQRQTRLADGAARRGACERGLAGVPTELGAEEVDDPSCFGGSGDSPSGAVIVVSAKVSPATSPGLGGRRSAPGVPPRPTSAMWTEKIIAVSPWTRR
jgi:hypothetical protein